MHSRVDIHTPGRNRGDVDIIADPISAGADAERPLRILIFPTCSSRLGFAANSLPTDSPRSLLTDVRSRSYLSGEPAGERGRPGLGGELEEVFDQGVARTCAHGRQKVVANRSWIIAFSANGSVMNRKAVVCARCYGALISTWPYLCAALSPTV